MWEDILKRGPLYDENLSSSDKHMRNRFQSETMPETAKVTHGDPSEDKCCRAAKKVFIELVERHLGKELRHAHGEDIEGGFPYTVVQWNCVKFREFLTQIVGAGRDRNRWFKLLTDDQLWDFQILLSDWERCDEDFPVYLGEDFNPGE